MRDECRIDQLNWVMSGELVEYLEWCWCRSCPRGSDGHDVKADRDEAASLNVMTGYCMYLASMSWCAIRQTIQCRSIFSTMMSTSTNTNTNLSRHYLTSSWCEQLNVDWTIGRTPFRIAVWTTSREPV